MFPTDPNAPRPNSAKDPTLRYRPLHIDGATISRAHGAHGNGPAPELLTIHMSADSELTDGTTIYPATVRVSLN